MKFYTAKYQSSQSCPSDQQTPVNKPQVSKIKFQQQENQQKIQLQKQQVSQKCEKVQTPVEIPNKKIQIVAISDNHGDYKMMNSILKLRGDIFIHGGDFTYYSKQQHFQKFYNFLEKLNFKHKIVVSGNHQNVLSKIPLKGGNKITRQKILQELKKRCHYLEHQMIEIQGIKIFGSPYTPEYCQKPNGRAFQYKSQHQKVIWDHLPQKIDILVTHGPPFGILDNGKGGKRAGSEYLSKKVQQISPRYHVFGHIHEGKGMFKKGNTIYLNVCNSPTRIVF